MNVAIAITAVFGLLRLRTKGMRQDSRDIGRHDEGKRPVARPETIVCIPSVAPLRLNNIKHYNNGKLN